MSCIHLRETACEGWFQCASPRTHHPFDLVRLTGSCNGCSWKNEPIEPRETYRVTPEVCEKYERSKLPPPPGAGTWLTRFFDRLYIKESEDCGCHNLALAMDRGGPEWCDKHFDDIVGKLAENARNRNIPFSRWLAVGLVKKSIAWARSEIQRYKSP